MTKSKILAVAILLLFVVGCASSGNKNPIVFVDRNNNIPADTPSQFLNRYKYFITGKEQKEFQKLLTDEERLAFIDKFWAERDTNPVTPQNEYKQEIDDRIDDITNERFFSSSDTTGLLFRSNGGFQGDMAKVYLLYGEPDAMDLLEGRSFVNMMLWVYINPENGNILYAFLFYQKGNSVGQFFLFPQDSYKMDGCGAVNEIMIFKDYSYFGGGNQACPPNVEQVFQEIQLASGRGGVLDGYLFAWALFNFSQDGSLLQGTALEPPKPASEIAKQSKARVAGEAPKLIGTAGTDYILASCDGCKSFIPAELQFDKELALSVRRGDIDWRIVNGQAKSELKIRVVIEDTTSHALIMFEKWATIKSQKDLIVSDPAGRISVKFLTADEMARIPPGTYWVNIYAKNLMTKKYNAWSKEFTK